jgi:hypothetical protein
MPVDVKKLFTDVIKVGVDPIQSTIAHFSSHGSGLNIGVDGSSDKGTGVLGAGGAEGVVGIGDNVGVSGYSQSGDGVVGDSQSATGDAIKGTNRGNGNGRGVAGFSNKGQGVYGHSISQAGVVGESDMFDGVFGLSHNKSAAGVSGHNPDGLAGFFDGNVTVTGNATIQGNIDVIGPGSDIRMTNADCAEDFDVCGSNGVEPGSVMIFNDEGELSLCQKAYDKRVAGVISGAGDYKPAIVLDARPASGNRQPVALIGKVFCKVDAEYGAIEVGDLLTTSLTPGHAMAVSETDRALGTVIGKALRPLSSGQGCIPILVALQ